jgi:hypothetical protein
MRFALRSRVGARTDKAAQSFGDADKLESPGQSGNPLTPFDQDVLPPALEAGYRQGLGPRGKGTSSSYSMHELCMRAQRAEFRFHTTARPTLGKRQFLAAQRTHLTSRPIFVQRASRQSGPRAPTLLLHHPMRCAEERCCRTAPLRSRHRRCACRRVHGVGAAHRTGWSGLLQRSEKACHET